MRHELNTKGKIVEYDGDTQRIEDTKATIEKLFSQGVFTSKVLNRDGSVYTLERKNEISDIEEIFDIFYGSIRNESRNDKEKKIQLNGKNPLSSGNRAIILGLYCFNSNDDLTDLICATWMIDNLVNYESNPSIRGINIDLFQKAKIEGFVKNAYRNNVVCVFRPEFIDYYIANQDTIHQADVTPIQQPQTPTSPFSHSTNKIFFGAPGTGKSHRVNQLIAGKEARTERVTFHPEYDYFSFVGGYKPVSEENEEGKSEISYKFQAEVFTNLYVKAWRSLDEKQEEDFYLVIEEINRGNCAEIFGDIFQLLDRQATYAISPSADMLKYLQSELAENGQDGIAGDKMRLPSNLNILATMNTSDQSLFPMDSAFKRRWQWEYVPICYDEFYDSAEEKRNESYDYEVFLDESTSFRWIEFLKVVNEKIRKNPVLGMDKCLGNYFIKSENGEISLEEFVNKAIFYLWNDVFKDEDRNSENIFSSGVSYENFFPIATNGKEEVEGMLKELKIDIEKQESDENPD